MYTKSAWPWLWNSLRLTRFQQEPSCKDKTWGARGVLCKWDNLMITWNWKWLSNQFGLGGGDIGFP